MSHEACVTIVPGNCTPRADACGEGAGDGTRDIDGCDDAIAGSQKAVSIEACVVKETGDRPIGINTGREGTLVSDIKHSERADSVRARDAAEAEMGKRILSGRSPPRAGLAARHRLAHLKKTPRR
jgi:hypothetical protein